MTIESDSAAIFATATSLWDECQILSETEPLISLSCEFKGLDSLMRLLMEIAGTLEMWATKNVAFDQFIEVWPYYLHENFEKLCLEICELKFLATFDISHCQAIAAKLNLPLNKTTTF